MNGAFRDPDDGHRRDTDNEFRRRLWLALPIALLFLVEALVTDPHPFRFVVFAVGFGFTMVAAILVARSFRSRVLVRVPSRFSESPSTPIRVVTKVAKGYATYVIGFWTVIAIVVLFQIIGHFI